MNLYDLANSSVLLHSPSDRPSERSHTTTYDTLCGAGFRTPSVLFTKEDLQQPLAEDKPELLVLNQAARSRDLSSIIEDVRNGRLGANPYLVIQVVAWNPGPDTIQTLVNAGADDIVVMPASVSDSRRTSRRTRSNRPRA